ncbi:MAG: aldo/keto reductase [Lachnospiraceae bacterium]|nr:aldo/keto reductase [Lachnospiraceae bacterium]
MKKLGFGLMRLPLLEGGSEDQIDIELMKKMTDLFMERGFTYYDTAYMYHRGMSERAFKEAVVERFPRECFTITDKMPMMMVQEEADLERLFNEQLERTGAGYFDYYWLHNLNRRSYETAVRTNAFAFVQKKMEEGLVKHLGFSFHDNAELLDRILTEHPETEIVQLQINYLDWNDPFVQSGKCYDVAVKHGKLITVMEPVKGGKLAALPEEAMEKLRAIDPEASPASFAIRFVASLPNVFMVLSGMSNLAQMEDNSAFMQEFNPLTEEEKEVLEECADIIRRSKAVPCTACRYCTEGCPMQIPIPDYFVLYNNVLENPGSDWTLQGNRRNYARLQDAGAGKASECLGCGLCEATCPQHINIPELMPKLAEVLEG